MNHQAVSSFIWSVADFLRGDYKQSEYGRVILPFTVLRRLDSVLEPTKKVVLADFEAKTNAGLLPTRSSPGKPTVVLRHVTTRPGQTARRPGPYPAEPLSGLLR